MPLAQQVAASYPQEGGSDLKSFELYKQQINNEPFVLRCLLVYQNKVPTISPVSLFQYPRATQPSFPLPPPHQYSETSIIWFPRTTEIVVLKSGSSNEVGSAKINLLEKLVVKPKATRMR